MGIESCNKIKVILFASLEEDMGWKEKILRIDNNVEMKVNSIWAVSYTHLTLPTNIGV